MNVMYTGSWDTEPDPAPKGGKLETYRVEIVSIETGQVESVIGTNLPERKMEKRILTGLSRINTDKYFVREVLEKPRRAK